MTPVLRLTSGKEVPLAAITVDPADSKPVDVGLAISAITSANVDSAPMYGSAILRFNGGSPANVFVAAIVRRVGYPIAFHFDALPPDESGIPGTRETLWVLPTTSATTYVVATNTSSRGSAVRFTVSDANGKSRSEERRVGKECRL